MRLITITLLASALLLTSCATANWYQSAKARGEVKCREEPPGQYEECMRRYDKTYQEYKKEREEAIQQ